MKRAHHNKNGGKRRTIIYLPPPIHKWLKGAAERDGTTISQKGAKLIVDSMRAELSAIDDGPHY